MAPPPQRSAVLADGPPLELVFPIGGSRKNSQHVQDVIKKLNLEPNIEGGLFVETDRDEFKIPSGFSQHFGSGPDETKNASTSIYYLLTPESPIGAFHRNKARTVHTLHSGRGRYVIIHADEVGSKDNRGGYGADESVPERERWIRKARVESFIVGHDILKGERLQWIVDGGKYKCSFLLPDENGKDSEGLLISETVVPGFEYADHDFMRAERMDALVTKEQAKEMQWMLRKAD